MAAALLFQIAIVTDEFQVALIDSSIVAAVPRHTITAFSVTGPLTFEVNEIEKRVLLAIHPDIDNLEEVARRSTLDPQLVPGRAPERGHAFI